jgi:DNA-binding CsgD family transcriptional regulator
MDYALEYHRYLDRLNERCKIIPLSYKRDDLNKLEAFEYHICIFDDKQDIFDTVNRAADSIKPIESNKDSKGELTSREKEILQLVVKGLSSRAIADILGISVQTVSTHRKNISAKLEIKTVSGLTVYAALNNLINIDEAELI